MRCSERLQSIVGWLCLAAAAVLCPQLSWAEGPAFLLRDINVGPDPDDSSDARDFIAVGGVVYFTADDRVHGRELWKTDWTADGTVLVKDINPGMRSSNPFALTAAGDTLFLFADDGTHGFELWRSNGTEAGTVLVADVSPADTNPYPRSLGLLRGAPFFVIANYATGTDELWRSDGTSTGTVRVATVDNVDAVTVWHDSLFFIATSYERGSSELWRSDGTADGTVVVRAVESLGASFFIHAAGALFFADDECEQLWATDGTEPGTGPVARPGLDRCVLAATGRGLFFLATDEASGIELWSSDATPAGTQIVRDINPGPRDAFSSEESDEFVAPALTVVNGTLFFVANDGQHGFQMWKSDGSAPGTTSVKDLGNTAGLPPHSLTNVNGTLFFIAGAASGGAALWKTDGTDAGTTMLSNLWSPAAPIALIAVNDALFFSAYDEFFDYELWTSDGTETGTRLVKDIYPGANSSYPTRLQEVNGTLAFLANDGSGREPWISDGTDTGTHRVKDIRPSEVGSTPTRLTDVGGTLFFTAIDARRLDLWRSDGTDSGTIRVKGPFAPPDQRQPRWLTSMNDTLFFSSAGELWRSDGSARGTVGLDFFAWELANINGTLFFTAGAQLWRSDGTAAGTMPITAATQGNLYPEWLTNVGGTLFFAGVDPMHGRELWRSDGTASGTARVSDIQPGEGFSSPADLTDVDGRLFFVAGDGQHGRELWTSDGGEAGTLLVKDIKPGSGSALDSLYAAPRPRSLAVPTAVGGRLFFVADDGRSGRELWRSDGTETQTVRVADLNPGSSDAFYHPSVLQSFAPVLADLDGALFFAAADDTHGFELWKTDGTEAGTTLVKDINPGVADSTPARLTVVKGKLVFSADDGMHGRELWASDGTAAGTVMLQDIAPGEVSSDPSSMVVSGDSLFFVADDGRTGREVWAMPNGGVIPCTDACPTPRPTRPIATPTPTPTGCADDELACMEIGFVSGRPGERVAVDIILHAAVDIAGIQNDISFDLATPIAARTDARPDCDVNSAIDKAATAFAFQPHGCTRAIDCRAIRAVVLAVDNTASIPDGSVLYTCRIAIGDRTTGGTRPLVISQALGSDPDGNGVRVRSANGAIAVLPAAPRGTRAAASTGTGSSGCQVASGGNGIVPYLLLPAAMLLRRPLSSAARNRSLRLGANAIDLTVRASRRKPDAVRETRSALG